MTSAPDEATRFTGCGFRQRSHRDLRALDVDPVNLEAFSTLAAAHYLRGSQEEFEAVEERVLGINPRFAGFYNLMADACVRNRFYHQAVDFARRALEVEPLTWRGYGLLGLNQLRVGQIEEGRRHLETSFLIVFSR